MGSFGQDLSQQLPERKEKKLSEKAQNDLEDLRRERTRYRGLLYDAIQERNQLLESREISRREDRIAKTRVSNPLRLVD